MKVLLINGSPHKEGCTYTALREIADTLEKEHIDTEIIQIGAEPISGCVGCGTCAKTKSGKCALNNAPIVNEIIEKAWEADGFILGSPVHFAAASGLVTALLDRVFYAGKPAFAYKPGAAVVSCRRAGSSAALDQLNKYFTISNMPVVSAQYWNMVHGNRPEEVKQDLEGMSTMRNIGHNMAWLLKCIEAGKVAGIGLPEAEPKVRTNFIR